VPCVADMGDQVRMSMSFVFDLHEMESISTSMLHPDIFVQNRPPLATTQYIQPHSVFPSPIDHGARRFEPYVAWRLGGTYESCARWSECALVGYGYVYVQRSGRSCHNTDKLLIDCRRGRNP
jgi:hypothetical protein